MKLKACKLHAVLLHVMHVPRHAPTPRACTTCDGAWLRAWLYGCRHLRDLMADEGRSMSLIRESEGIYADLSRQRVTIKTMQVGGWGGVNTMWLGGRVGGSQHDVARWAGGWGSTRCGQVGRATCSA